MRAVVHVMEVGNRDKSIGMLGVILATLGTTNFEGIAASFVQTDER